MNQENIAILGRGIEGQALERYFQKKGFAQVTVLDEKEDPKAFQNLAQYDRIFRSPGIRLDRPELQGLEAKLTSLTQYFFDHCPCPIIGVTGTKGKGTTSTLIYEMLKADGKDVYLGGNIGLPPTEFLDKLTPQSLVVLELSSFQLEDLKSSPHIAIVLNVTSEHLDHHPNTEAYRQAKTPIVRFQKPADIKIINEDYEGSRAFAALGEGKSYFYSRKKESAAAEAHLHTEEGAEKIIALNKAIADRQDIALRGDHNLENVLPACLAATLLGVPAKTIQKTLRTFKGLPHRLEEVAQIKGVTYVNDSFSTTPETSIAGIQAFAEPLYLIAGGSEKHSDFTEWGKACAAAKNLKAVLLIGETAPRLEAALPDSVNRVHTKTLEASLEWLQNKTEPGNVVLLSPACASFDQFDNYKHRGESFKKMLGR